MPPASRSGSYALVIDTSTEGKCAMSAFWRGCLVAAAAIEILVTSRTAKALSIKIGDHEGTKPSSSRPHHKVFRDVLAEQAGSEHDEQDTRQKRQDDDQALKAAA